MRKKILFISHTSYLYGAEYCLFDLLQHLNRNKYEALVLFPNEGPLKEKVEYLGWKTLIFDMPWWITYGQRERWHFRLLFQYLPRRVAHIRKLIKDEKADLVYTNTIACIDGAIAARLEDKPHMWHIHEIIRGHNAWKPYLPPFLMAFVVSLLSNRVIVPSKVIKDQISLKYNGEKIRVINNGVDLRKFSQANSKQGLRRELGINKDTKIVAMIGSISKIKGHLDFVEAARDVYYQMENTIFVVVGSAGNSYSQVVKDRVKELGISDRIRFMGFRDDIADILKSADLVVSASWVESFSRVICEAMAAGKPVVATRCGGPEEIVVDGETGLLVPIKSPKMLSEAILRVLSNDEAAKEMGEMGRQRAGKYFNLEQYISNIEKVIGELC